MPRCFICEVNFSLDGLQNHFENYHHYGYHQLFKCIEPLCSGCFDNFDLLRRHYVTEHRLSQVPSVKSQVPQNQNNIPDISIVRVRKLFKQKLLSNVITMYGLMNISRQQFQEFFDIIQDIIKSDLNIIYDELQTAHGHNSITSKIRADVASLFKGLNNSFVEFQTEHKRLNEIEKTGYFIKPIEYLVGKNTKTNRRDIDGNVGAETVHHTACFFPLGAMLKKIFEIDHVYDTVIHYKKSLEDERTLQTNFIQSEVWQERIKNFPSKQVLPLFLYYDDFEAGNPPGAHAGTNKIGGTYISVPCFPPQYQSSLLSIFHALLFYSKDREEFGNFAIFRPLIEELRNLELEGIELDLPQGKTTIYFKLGLILGDNLGLHSLLGLVECFRANYCCRFCRMDAQQRSLATLEDEYFSRNVINYNSDLAKNDLNSTGIKRECVLSYST